MSNEVDGVREVSPAEARRLQLKGLIADLSRDEATVHVGKPVGSITGWVGPIFWQVWIDAGDEDGTVHARIDQAAAQLWRFDAGQDKAAILAEARERLVGEVQALRRERLDAARARLAALPDV